MQAFLFLLLGLSISISISTHTANPLQIISNKITTGISSIKYSLHTSDTQQTMDCLKISQSNTNHPQFGIFHTSNSQTHYSQLFYSQNYQSKWMNTVKISQRGSQGYIKQININGIFYGYLIGYQLENTSGNKIALRYYENQQHIKSNNFVYEYQLLQNVSGKIMKNIGTVSIEEIVLVTKKDDIKMNQYRVSIKFHYCPDGLRDYPGMGTVNLKPLRDFVDAKGNWRGGCYENYRDWIGIVDFTAQGALRQAGCGGKIGQRDYFYFGTEVYYLYECNINPDFDWYSWRIVLYSPTLKQARPLGLSLGGDIDIANPHITLLKQNGNTYTFVMTYFMPSEGCKPDLSAKPGECVVQTMFTYP